MKSYLKPMIFAVGIMTTLGSHSAHGVDRNFTVIVEGIPPTTSTELPRLYSFHMDGHKYWCEDDVCNVNGSQNPFPDWRDPKVFTLPKPGHQCSWKLKNGRDTIHCMGDISHVQEQGLVKAKVNGCHCTVEVMHQSKS